MQASDSHYNLISLDGKQVLFTRDNIDEKSLSNNFFVYKLKNHICNREEVILCRTAGDNCYGTIISKESLALFGKFIKKKDIITLSEDCTIEDYKGYCITFVNLDTGKPRVYKRCKTRAEVNTYIHDIYSENSGWAEEELQSVSIISDYNYMPPY